MCWAWTVSAAPTAGTILYHEPLQLMKAPEDTGAGAQRMRLSVDFVEVIRFEAFGRTFELHVQRNERLHRRRISADFELLTGKVAGDRDSWVRLTRRGASLSGIIRTGGDIYGIEPGDVVAPAALNPARNNDADNAIFRLADVLIPAGAATCGVDDNGTAMRADQAFAELASELNSPQILAAAGAAEQIDVSALGDFEFFSQFGSSAESELLARFNIVDGIFSEQLGVAIAVSDPTVFTSSGGDPFSPTTNASDLLDEVMDYRVANDLSSYGLTHLLTGKNLDGSTVGIAVRGDTTPGGLPLFGACTSSGVGLSQTQSFLTSTSALIIAHEIGHNFGALHDGAAADPGDDPNPCDGTPPTFLMAPSLNGSSTFSQCSLNTMQVIVDAATCLTPAPLHDVAVTAPADFSIGVGGQFDLEFTISNTGDIDVSGVVGLLGVPTSTTLINLTSSQGSCNLLVAECVLGTLAQGQAALITATLNADAGGDAMVSLTAQADADSNPANDEGAVTVTIDDSVDVTSSLTGAAALDRGQTGQAQISVANLSSLDASNVEVTVSGSAGLTITEVASPQGSCSLAACNLGNLDGLSSIQITVSYSADEAGAQILSAAAASNESDSVPANNASQLNVAVNEPPAASAASSSGGGGGSLGFATLLGLIAAARRGRFRDR